MSTQPSPEAAEWAKRYLALCADPKEAARFLFEVIAELKGSIVVQRLGAHREKLDLEQRAVDAAEDTRAQCRRACVRVHAETTGGGSYNDGRRAGALACVAALGADQRG